MENNYKLCCRTCLQFSDHMFDLFSHCDGDGTVTADMLTSCTSLKVEFNDGLPKTLCETCYNKLTGAYLYRKQAVASDVKLRTCLKPKPVVKVEHTTQVKIEYDHQENELENQDNKLEDNEFEHRDTAIKHESNNVVDQGNECDNNDSLQDSDKDDDAKPLIEIQKEKRNIIRKRSIKIYACPFCLAVFSKLAEKKLHLKEKHPNPCDGNGSFKCKECPKNFPTFLRLKRHMKTHSGVSPFRCTICSISFKKKHLLTDHWLKHRHETKILAKAEDALASEDTDSTSCTDMFKCKVCSEEFQSRFSLSAHMGKHTAPGIYTCTECDKTFPRQSQLKQHKNLKHVKTPMTCDLCDETFETRSLLIHHLKKQHKGSQQYCCQFCSKEFMQKESWMAHLEVHMGLKSFLCTTCGKQFEGARNLKLHIKRHLGDKSFACSYCKKKFVTSGELKAHTVMHTGDRRWKCDVCDYMSTKSAYLARHKLMHSDVNPFQCDICHLRYPNKDDLNRHFRNHTEERPNKCDLCDSSFYETKGLLKHRKRVHFGEKIYSCDQCPERFRLMAELNKHLSDSEHCVAEQAALDEAGANVEPALNKETSNEEIEPQKNATVDLLPEDGVVSKS